MEISKIKHLVNQFEDWDKQGKKYVFSIDYINSNVNDESMQFTAQKDNVTGAEKFEEYIYQCIEKYDAEKIQVATFTGQNGKLINKPVDILIRPTGANNIINISHPRKKESEQTQQVQNEFNGFSGLDGMERFFSMKEETLNLGVEKRILEESLKEAQRKAAEYKEKYEKLEKEHDELYDTAKELEEAYESVQKYIPGKGATTIGGVDLFQGAAFIGNKIIKNIVTKNPDKIAGILGVSSSELSGLFEDEEEVTPTVSAPATAGMTEDQQKQMEVCNMIYEMCQKATAGELKMIWKYFQYIVDDPENLNKVNEFIINS